MLVVGTMSTKLMFVLALALGASACVTDDDESVPTESELEDPPLPPSEYPDDPTCGGNALKGDGACLPD